MSQYVFNGQRQGENIQLIIRSNPRLFLSPGIKIVVVAALFSLLVGYLPSHYLFIVGAILVLIALYFGLEAFFRFKNSMAIVTNQRVIVIEKRGLFHKEVSETDFDKIQELLTVKKGILNFILGCGDLLLRTNHGQGEDKIIIKGVVDPYEIQQQIAALKRSV